MNIFREEEENKSCREFFPKWSLMSCLYFSTIQSVTRRDIKQFSFQPFFAGLLTWNSHAQRFEVIQSIPVLWPKVVIFGALRWPHQWFYQQRVVIWLWVDALGYNISKNQLPKSKTMASSHKKVHFWNPIWGTPSALWNGPSPISLSFLFWSRWDSVCQCTLGRPWFVPNLIKIHQDLAKI